MQALLSIWLPLKRLPSEEHATMRTKPFFTTSRIIDRLSPGRSNILSMSHCVLMALGNAREGTRTPKDFSTRS